MPSLSWLVAASTALVLCASALEAQQRYVDGVFVQTPTGPFELIAYAEPATTGRLRLAHGSMDDVPAWGAGCRVLVSLPAWRAAGAMVATDAIFEDPLAERRDVRWFIRSLNIYAAELEFKELAKADFVARMLRSVEASEEAPGLLFVVVSDRAGRVSGAGFTRFYPVRLEADASAACRQ